MNLQEGYWICDHDVRERKVYPKVDYRRCYPWSANEDVYDIILLFREFGFSGLKLVSSGFFMQRSYFYNDVTVRLRRG